MSTFKELPDGITDLAATFMWSIIFWNHAESTAKHLAQLLLGGSAISMAITAEIGNRTLLHGIETASREGDMGEMGEHLRHFCSGYEILLGYRNFYVHALYATRASKTTKNEMEGMLLSIDGKGKLRAFNQPVTAADFASFTRHTQKLIAYGAAIQKALGATGDGLDAMIRNYSASLEKPQWPSRIEKTAHYLQGQEVPFQGIPL